MKRNNDQVSKKKQDELNSKMAALKLKEAEIEIRYIQGSGKGGQKVNKTASCVQLKYAPLKLVIKCQETRSRELNLFLAKRRLVEKVEAEMGIQSKKDLAIEKLRKQKKRRKRRGESKDA